MRQRINIREHFWRAMRPLIQIAALQTALSNGCYPLEQRLARWLLMCHDRVAGDDLSTTHEFLSLMLGVRRAGVTGALQALEDRGTISTKGLSPNNRVRWNRIEHRLFAFITQNWRGKPACSPTR